MIKKIFGTFGTQVLNAICNFVTLWFGTHYLGDEAWGIGGIVLLDVSILLIGVEFLAGSGLIYFTPRKSYRTLFKISYIWSALVVAFYALLTKAFPSTFSHHCAAHAREKPTGGVFLLSRVVYAPSNPIAYRATSHVMERAGKRDRKCHTLSVMLSRAV